eukprot:m.572586 g.572586  ORF g.572586 m.572586 type:complete len:284 (+) comp22271_c1_seq2:44-895(+)
MWPVLLSACALLCAPASIAAVDFDVVVYGSTPAGIAAATAAGHLGMKVALYEPLKMIGGMGAAGNLALNDGGNGAEHTGLAFNFTTLNAQYYGVSGQVAHPESFVANNSFYKMLDAANVQTIKLDCRLLDATPATDALTGVSKVESIKLFCEEDPITATVFIDASYDGEIMTAVGNVDYTWGREAIKTYNESYAGARVPGWNGALATWIVLFEWDLTCYGSEMHFPLEMQSGTVQNLNGHFRMVLLIQSILAGHPLLTLPLPLLPLHCPSHPLLFLRCLKKVV